MNETLLDRAFRNLKVAKSNYNNIKEDEFYINVTGFLLQQSLELALKHLLEINSIKYPYTHDISVLFKLTPNNVMIPVELKLSSGTITLWESKTRYVKNFFLEVEQIDLLMPIIESFLLSISPAGMSPEKFNKILESIPDNEKDVYGFNDIERVLNYKNKNNNFNPIDVLRRDSKD